MLLDQIFLLVAGGNLFLGAYLFVALTLNSRTAAPRWLGALVLVCALNAAHPAVMHSLGMLASSGQLFEPIQFLLAPLLAAYASAVRGEPWRWRPALLLHLLPFAGAVAVSAVFMSEGQSSPLVSVAFWVCLTIQMAAYLVPALGRFHDYQVSLPDRVSNLASSDLGWLRSFFWVAAGLCLLSGVVAVLLHMVAPASLAPWVTLVMTAAVWVLGYRGSRQKEPAPAADRAPLPSDEAKRLAETIVRTFETARPHLDPDLDLAALAVRVGAPRNHLSFAINSELKVNFYDLVNGWRLREFQTLAADPARDGDKLLTLALDSGFNAKPTFNTVVRRLTGKTPSQVRAEQIASRRSR